MVAFLFFALPVKSQAPIREPEPDLVALAYQIADEYEVPRETMYAVVNCESSFNPDAIGDGGDSHGLSQINLPSHRNVTEEMAHDPQFALRFLAGHLKAGDGNMWTCFRNYKAP